MIKLPTKFSGTQAEQIEFRPFYDLCYLLEDMDLLKVIKLDGAYYPNNYYRATVVDDFGEFCIYLNCYVPIIGIGRISDNSEEYLEKPKLISAISILDCFQVLTPLQLKENVTEGHLENLTESEKREVRGCLPDTVGRLLFSWYFD